MLWCLFRSGTKCSLNNNAYRRYNGKEVGSLSLTVFVISVNTDCPIVQIKTSFISSSSWSLYCGNFSLEFVIFDRSNSRVIFIYWVNFLHQSFALVWSFFSMIGRGNFWVVVRLTYRVVVLFGSERLLVSPMELFGSSSIVAKFFLKVQNVDCAILYSESEYLN